MESRIPSVSSYHDCRDERPPRKVVGEILEAGRRAPSPGNVHSKEFIVVESHEKLERLSELTDDERIEESPICVAVVVSPDRMERNLGEGAGRLSRLESVASVQNMRITAENYGLSSVWLSGFNSKYVSESLEVPKEKKITDLVCFGYAENPIENKPDFGMNEIVFYDMYNNQYDSLLDGLELKGYRETKEVVERKNRGLKRIFRKSVERIKKLVD